jgi:hypothetical protein
VNLGHSSHYQLVLPFSCKLVYWHHVVDFRLELVEVEEVEEMHYLGLFQEIPLFVVMALMLDLELVEGHGF